MACCYPRQVTQEWSGLATNLNGRLFGARQLKRANLLTRSVPCWVAALVATTTSHAIAVDGSGSNCLDALKIDVTGHIRDAEFKEMLRHTSIPRLDRSSCSGARVSVQQTRQGWHLKFASGGKLVERDVDTLQHAATWVDAWIQSGFGPVAAETAAAQPGAGSAGAETSASANATAPAAAVGAVQAPGAEIGVSFDAVTALTVSGYAYLGGQLETRFAPRQPFNFGAVVGGAFQLDPNSNSYRRELWAGSLLGRHFQLSPRWHFDPQLGFGVVAGSANANGCKNHSAGAYISLGGLFAFDLSQRLSLMLGLAGRAVAPHLLGDNTVTCPTGTGEVEDGASTVVYKPAASVDSTWVALTSGLEWRFGGMP